MKEENMSEPKPIHVLIAEALGCKPVYSTDPRFRAKQFPACQCEHPGHRAPGNPTYEMARYDTDWSATGPLIERYAISLASPFDFIPSEPDLNWKASFQKGCMYPHYADSQTQQESSVQCTCINDVEGETPLLAVCALLLALSAAGKLR